MRWEGDESIKHMLVTLCVINASKNCIWNWYCIKYSTISVDWGGWWCKMWVSSQVRIFIWCVYSGILSRCDNRVSWSMKFICHTLIIVDMQWNRSRKTRFGFLDDQNFSSWERHSAFRNFHWVFSHPKYIQLIIEIYLK